MLIHGLSVLAASLLYLFLARSFPQTMHYELTTWIVGTVPTYGIALFIGLPLMRLLEKKTLYKNPVRPGFFLKAFCIIIFLTYAGSMIGSLLNNLLAGTTGFSVDTTVTDLAEESAVGWVFLFAVIIAPIMEELIFRKLLIDRIIVFGDGPAILLSAVIFGLIHGNITQCVYAFLVGWVLGYVYVRTGRITASILLHMLMNLAGSALPLLVEQICGVRSPGYWIYLIVLCVLFLIGLVCFILTIVRRRIQLLAGERSARRVRIFAAAASSPGILCFLLMALFVFFLNASAS